MRRFSGSPTSGKADRRTKPFYLRYTRRDPQHVERHLISDYLNSVAVAVEKDSVHESHPGEVIMAAVPVTYVNVQHRIHDQRERTRKFYSSSKPPFEVPIKSPFEGGPRLALLYLAFEALRAYGVLNQRARLINSCATGAKTWC